MIVDYNTIESITILCGQLQLVRGLVDIMAKNTRSTTIWSRTWNTFGSIHKNSWKGGLWL